MAFTADGLEFLRALEANNNRDWFQPRKDEYEKLLREPMTNAVEHVNAMLGKIAPDYITDPGKAIYRVYRDTRFSKDKTPYKTHIGALLWHRRLGKNGGAVFYFHVSTQELLVAGGVYKPDAAVLIEVRRHIAAEQERLDRILHKPVIREFFDGLHGEQLSRPPKGWPADHPAVAYLKHKDLLLETSAPAEAAVKPDAADWICERFHAMAPFIEFLNEPLLARAAKPRDPLL